MSSERGRREEEMRGGVEGIAEEKMSRNGIGEKLKEDERKG